MQNTILSLILILTVSNIPFLAQADTLLHMAKQPDAPVTKAGLPIFTCAMETMNQHYQLHDVPWKRAQMGTETGEYNGFLMARQTPKRNEYAVASLPFVFTDWVYVVNPSVTATPDDENFHTLKFGANLGTARHTWLTKQKKFTQSVVSASDAESAWRMLTSHRMDVLLDNRADLNRFRARHDPQGRFKIYTARQVELSAYFSKTYVKGNPEFLPAFNEAVSDCLKQD